MGRMARSLRGRGGGFQNVTRDQEAAVRREEDNEGKGRTIDRDRNGKCGGKMWKKVEK